ncbi:unnamed protein product [Adineta ricciae]|uniref:Uncharacterized protein n=1 Tax=Adineta ricciae TaxID=249248 RepID=A0A813UBJ3_ADIRI|nr:unnamed protein product [Adineta ricciae]CAF0925687.1 unnamed protein product [Adineta ricciae]
MANNKRMRFHSNENHANDNHQMSVDEKILSSDFNYPTQPQTTSNSNTQAYHLSVCGSILYSPPTNSPSDIFTFLRHGNFDAFRRSLDIYHNDIIRMRNDHGQTVLHVLVIHAYPYIWVRLLMLRGCDTCAQDNDGYTAAHYAVERDDVEMLKAVTLRIHPQVKPIPEEQIVAIYEQCCRALSIKENNGLTPFMLACQHQSMKCLDYLIEMNINDCHLQDKFGDTCLHYAVGRRNLNLVQKLIQTCKADVNGGEQLRPSTLDVLQHNRAQQKPFDRNLDDEIEQVLLSSKAKNRCSIRRIISKRKDSLENDDSALTKLACLSIDSMSTNEQLETARGHARLATTLQAKNDPRGALESFKNAMTCTPDNSLDWATYALQSALIHMMFGENQAALGLLHKALHIRTELERTSDQIDQIQRAINQIQPSTF